MSYNYKENLEKYPNLAHKCKVCGDFSVNMNYCAKHYKVYVKKRFNKFIEYLLIKRQLSHSTVFSYVAQLNYFKPFLFEIDNTKKFKEELIKYINSHRINFVKPSTVSITTSALKNYLFFLGKDQHINIISRVFVKIKQKRYGDVIKPNKTKIKYWTYDVIVNELIDACRYKIVSPENIITDSEKRQLKAIKKEIMADESLQIRSKNNKYYRIKKKILIKNHKLMKLPYKSRNYKIINDDKTTLRNEAFILFLFTSGIRASESVWTRVRDINFEKRKFRVLGKGFKVRDAFITENMVNMLIQYLKVFNKKPNDRLFVFSGSFNQERNNTFKITIPSKYSMNRYYKKGLIQSIEEFYYIKRQAFLANMKLKEIGLITGKHLNPHSLRHSLGTHLINQGMGLHLISKILGHNDPKTTSIYAQINEKNKRKEYDNIMEKNQI